MYFTNRHHILFFLILAALLACSLPSLSGESSTEPPTAVPASQDAAESMEAKLEEVRNTPPGESVELTLTEQELTSYVAANLPQESQLDDVQVRLRDGRIHVTGKAPVGPLTQDFTLVVRPSVQDGAVGLEVIEATVGSIQLPEELIASANDRIRQTLRANDRLDVERIDVGEGDITIVGTRR